MKRKILSVILALTIVFSMGSNVFAGYYPAGSGNNYNNVYYGENYYNYNYSNNNYYGSYYMSPWTEDLKIAYDPTWYESPQRQVVRGEAFLVFLRAVQRSLDRQGYSRLMAGFNNVPFSDYNTVNPYAQGEVNVLYANGILIGFEDNTMRFSQRLTRAELAAIYSRFNRIYFNMGVGYNQWNYDGYNNYYNNNYNNYYNNYVFYDITGHWAAQDIITAASNGVLNGVGNGYFEAEGPLTIEQVWKALDNCVGYQGLKRSDIAYSMSQTFKVKFGKNIDESYGTTNGTKVTRLSASPSTISIKEGEKATIKVTITPTKADYQKLQWSFDNYSDNNYASIDEVWNSSSGIAYVRIYGKREKNSYMTLVGRAMDGSGVSVKVKVKVTDDYDYDYDYDDDEYITSITPSEETIYLNVGESLKVNARIRPSNANYMNLKWTSQNTNIARVTDVYLDDNYSNATITAYNPGTTYIDIEAQDGSGEEATIKVIVNANTMKPSVITSATANPAFVNMNVGNSKDVTLTLYPVDAYDKDTTWISTNENVAIVEKVSNTRIRIIGVGVGTSSIRGIAKATGEEICVIPVTINPNEDIDVDPPVVQCLETIITTRGETGKIKVTAHDENLKSFNILQTDVLGITKLGLKVIGIEQVADDTIYIHYQAIEACSGELSIAAGVAVDEYGNTSKESLGVYVLVNPID